MSQALTRVDHSLQRLPGKVRSTFLLSRVVEQTGGRSLAANLALVKNNAAVAADIAVEYSKLSADRSPT